MTTKAKVGIIRIQLWDKFKISVLDTNNKGLINSSNGILNKTWYPIKKIQPMIQYKTEIAAFVKNFEYDVWGNSTIEAVILFNHTVSWLV